MGFRNHEESGCGIEMNFTNNLMLNPMFYIQGEVGYKYCKKR